VHLSGTYEEIKNDPYLLQLKSIHKSHQKEQEEVQNKNQDEGQIVEKKKQDKSQHSISKVQLDKSKRNNGKIVSDEDDEIIKVGWNCYKTFFKNYFGGWKFILITIFAQVMFNISRIGSDFLIGNWA